MVVWTISLVAANPHIGSLRLAAAAWEKSTEDALDDGGLVEPGVLYWLVVHGLWLDLCCHAYVWWTGGASSCIGGICPSGLSVGLLRDRMCTFCTLD
jgi:hypothetical protein